MFKNKQVRLAANGNFVLVVRGGELTPFWFILQGYSKGLRFPWQMKSEYGVPKVTAYSSIKKLEKVGLADFKGKPNENLFRIAEELDNFKDTYELPSYYPKS